jgi:hypothetical protein
MTAEKVSDEMLMAFSDRELDADAAEDMRRAVAADPALQRRLAEFERTRALAKAAFAGVLEERVPERLIAAARPSGRRTALPRFRWTGGWLPAGAALAASAAGLAIGLMLARPAGVTPPSLIAAEPELAQLLETVPSGETRPFHVGPPDAGAGGVFEATATYEAPDGMCRAFRLGFGADDGSGWSGAACRQGGTWSVAVLAADTAAGQYETASDAAVQSIDAWLDAAGVGGALDPDEERRLVESGWTAAE